MTHQYSRAERLLTRPFPTSTSKRVSAPPEPIDGPVSDVFSSKGKSREQDPPQPTPLSIPRFPMGSGGMIEVPQEMQERVSRLVDMSVACRYLAAQCQVIHPCLYFGESSLMAPVGQTRQLGRSNRDAGRIQPFPRLWSVRIVSIPVLSLLSAPLSARSGAPVPNMDGGIKVIETNRMQVWHLTLC